MNLPLAWALASSLMTSTYRLAVPYDFYDFESNAQRCLTTPACSLRPTASPPPTRNTSRALLAREEGKIKVFDNAPSLTSP